jgi:hypothetical protein
MNIAARSPFFPLPRLRVRVGVGGRPSPGARRPLPPTQPPPQAGEGLYRGTGVP